MVLTVRTFTGSLGIALAALGSAAAIVVSSATPALAANQGLFINGIAGNVPLGLVKDAILGGAFASYDNTEVSWPQEARPTTGDDSLTLGESVTQGADNLDEALAQALTRIGPGEHVTIIGLSAGALVADEQLKRLLADPNAPDKSKLNFVVIADSSRSTFNANRYDNVLNYQYSTPVDTKYDTVVVVAEYDGFADFPDRVWNIVAVINAYAGEFLNHVPSVFTDLSTVEPSDITVTTNSLGGVTTKYFLPSEHLPLVELLPFLEPQEAELKQIVDSAYKRNDAPSAAASPAPAAAVAVANTADSVAVAEPQAVAPAAPQAVAPASVASAETPEVGAPAETVAAKQSVPAAEPATDPAPVADALDTATQNPAASSVDAPRQTGRPAASTRGSDGSGVTHRSNGNPARPAASSRADKSPSE
jgi:hypothetical protein